MQATNNCFRHFFGLGSLYLAFDRRIFNGAIFGGHFGLCPGNPLCIDDHVCLRSVPERRNCDVGGSNNSREGGNEGDQTPLAAEEVAYLKHGQRSGTGIVIYRRCVGWKLPGNVHAWFLKLTPAHFGRSWRTAK